MNHHNYSVLELYLFSGTNRRLWSISKIICYTRNEQINMEKIFGNGITFSTNNSTTLRPLAFFSTWKQF